MPSRQRRSALRTVRLVGEGKTEVAFLKHVKQLYLRRGGGISASIVNARGKGPDHVVNYAIVQKRNKAYNRVIALMDMDIPMSEKLARRAKSNKVRIIGSVPCIEGLLLAILGESVPSDSKVCKKMVSEKITGKLTDSASYKAKFTQTLIDQKRASVPPLRKLLNHMLFED